MTVTRWISLNDRYPDVKHRVPTGEHECPHCGSPVDKYYEVSDWVRVRTEHKNEWSIRARWNKTTGLWEQVIGHGGGGREIIDPVVAKFTEWRAIS